MAKYVIAYDLKMSMLKQVVELDHEPSEEEALEILNEMSGADLCGAALAPPDVEVIDVYKEK